MSDPTLPHIPGINRDPPTTANLLKALRNQLALVSDELSLSKDVAICLPARLDIMDWLISTESNLLGAQDAVLEALEELAKDGAIKNPGEDRG